MAEGVDVPGVSSLLTSAGFLMGRVSLNPAQPVSHVDGDAEDRYPVDFREIKGQEYAKRAVEVAAAGGHNVLALCP